MSEFGPAPSEDGLAEERAAWIERHDTRERVRHVVTGLRDPTSAAEIADRAGCSANAARKHLRGLAEERVVVTIEDPQGARYRRNDEYFRWRRAFDLSREHGEAALVEELAELRGRDADYRARFEASAPDVVDFPPSDGAHGDLHDQWEALTDWETVRRDVTLHEDALRLARRGPGERRLAD